MRKYRYILALILVIISGLLSRHPFIPKIIVPYLGDVLYAMMVFFIISIFSNKSSIKKAFIAILICYFIEFSQFYKADWITIIRSYKLGGLVLGFGFKWYDLISYIIGVGFGIGIDKLINRSIISNTN